MIEGLPQEFIIGQSWEGEHHVIQVTMETFSEHYTVLSKYDHAILLAEQIVEIYVP
tara:strand:+ start:221 stop:388 length:168 start_codon:yes stop_codon:yes gene_type:complete